MEMFTCLQPEDLVRILAGTQINLSILQDADVCECWMDVTSQHVYIVRSRMHSAIGHPRPTETSKLVTRMRHERDCLYVTYV